MQPSDEMVDAFAKYMGWSRGSASTVLNHLASLGFGDLTAAREAGRREGLEWAQNECLTQAHYQGAFGDRDKMAGCEWMSAKIGEAIRALLPETQKAPQP